ncbi:flagellar motility protein MotE (MotC chaperone) [Geothermobacter ehrlichii]|uniref:Flagellar motility protein MotE (MotC chaperone) n=1 Tax=Geothermobacter ehrlichii TaxID=213224 RepID=A0A5D3WNS8_9BACT|nr:hypothetical protein [Geothermobacter ehrlichii]TYP00208.1 flagellar motility protein MotE (MotC chaperone) [Geothermobacter ehrlichii]
MKKNLLAILALLCLTTPAGIAGAVDSPAAGGQAADSQATDSPAQPGPTSVEERRLLAEIEKHRQALKQKEEALREREIELDSLQRELEQRLARLESLRDEIARMLKQKDAAEQERLAELARMYEKMDKAKAARLLEKMDWDLSQAILARIKTKIRGKILTQMPPSYAIRFTRAYSTLERN